jgi:alpha-glucosidase
MSNHDFDRLATRVGPENLRAAAVLLLTLPGTAFVYQGDEIGLLDGPGGDPPEDRYGRDRARHPMQWSGDPVGGFTSRAAWLPPVDPAARNVADQEGDPGSLLHLYRALIDLRRTLAGGLEVVEADRDGLLVYRRGEATVALNLGPGERRVDLPGEILLATGPDAEPGRLGPGAGIVTRHSG